LSKMWDRRRSIDETPRPLRSVQMRLEATTFRTPEELEVVAAREGEELADLKILYEEDNATMVDLVFAVGTLRVHARRGRMWHPFYVDYVEPTRVATGPVRA
jgi:hypothetical protein